MHDFLFQLVYGLHLAVNRNCTSISLDYKNFQEILLHIRQILSHYQVDLYSLHTGKAKSEA